MDPGNGIEIVRVPRTRRPRPGRSWTILITALVAVGIGAAVGLIAHDSLFSKADSPSSKAVPPVGVTALGRLQPAGGVVPILGPPGDRIEKLYLDKDGRPIAPGTRLAKGQPVADLASKQQRDLELNVARIQLAESKQAVEAATAAGRKKIEAANAELAQVAANETHDAAAIRAKLDYLAEALAIAEGQVLRLESLRGEGVRVADEDYEKAKLARAQAKSELAATAAALEKTKTTYLQSAAAAKARIAAAEEELKEAVAKVPVQSAAERLKVAELLASQTTLKAPREGIVLKVAGKEGQPTGMEPVLLLAPIGDMVAIAEVYESDLERLHVLLRKGPVPVEIASPSLPGDRILRGRVESEADVNRTIARNQVFALGPREDADRRVVEVVVHLDAESSRTAARFVGLQVTVTFLSGK